MTGQKYKLYVYFTSTNTLHLKDVTEKGLKDWNKDLMAGVPFIANVGDNPYFVNPHYVIHTEVYKQQEEA